VLPRIISLKIIFQEPPRSFFKVVVSESDFSALLPMLFEAVKHDQNLSLFNNLVIDDTLPHSSVSQEANHASEGLLRAGSDFETFCALRNL
jgi:hypothetical protein